MNSKHCFALFGFVLILIISACGIIESSSDVNNTDFVASASFLNEVDAVGISRFQVDGINGSITISGGATSKIRITGERRVGSESQQDADAHLPELQIQITQQADEVRVKTIQPEHSNGRNYEVEYDITLPENMEIIVGEVNGSVTVDGILEDVSVANINGTILLSNLKGNLSVSLVNGEIDCGMELPGQGSAILGTVNGNIELRIPTLTSADFSANLVNGNINLSGLELHNSSSSQTSLRGTLGDGNGNIRLTTVNGSIRVRSQN